MRPDEAGHVEYLGVTVLEERPAALLVRVPRKDGSQTVWLPKAAIHDNSEVYRAGTAGRLVIPLRLAEEKGLPT